MRITRFWPAIAAATAMALAATPNLSAFESSGGDLPDLANTLNKPWQEFQFKGAKNASSRNGAGVNSIVIHTTEGSGVYENTINWFRNSSNNSNSAHFVIARDGRVTQMVDSSRRSWHATYYNRRSIGIEMSGFSFGHSDPNDDKPDTWRYEVGEIPDPHDPTPGDGYRSNLDTLAQIVAFYVDKYNVPLVHPTGEAQWHRNSEGDVVIDSEYNQSGLVAHGQIQPWSRRDPGPEFPWDELISRTNAILVPEPATASLFLGAGLLFLRRRRA
ncbi:N-acetylmuramoyl-L-alanine amidase [Poriferisphaera sp. WC338]|uniref:N-acetylmuramoyl-L-alanine amidase n=1 Tax=Poriferisphaera sp. WC338 TaxID=3425129 RepID=UPI003D8189BF